MDILGWYHMISFVNWSQKCQRLDISTLRTKNKYDKNGKREAISFITPFFYLQTNKTKFLWSLSLLFKVEKGSFLKKNSYIY